MGHHIDPACAQRKHALGRVLSGVVAREGLLFVRTGCSQYEFGYMHPSRGRMPLQCESTQWDVGYNRLQFECVHSKLGLCISGLGAYACELGAGEPDVWLRVCVLGSAQSNLEFNNWSWASGSSIAKF